MIFFSFIVQEDMHPSTHTSYYKYDFSDPGTSLYYNQPHGYENNEYAPRINEYRRPLENSPMMTYEEPTAAVSMQWGLNANIDSVECKYLLSFSFSPHQLD